MFRSLVVFARNSKGFKENYVNLLSIPVSKHVIDVPDISESSPTFDPLITDPMKRPSYLKEKKSLETPLISSSLKDCIVRATHLPKYNDSIQEQQKAWKTLAWSVTLKLPTALKVYTVVDVINIFTKKGYFDNDLFKQLFFVLSARLNECSPRDLSILILSLSRMITNSSSAKTIDNRKVLRFIRQVFDTLLVLISSADLSDLAVLGKSSCRLSPSILGTTTENLISLLVTNSMLRLLDKDSCLKTIRGRDVADLVKSIGLMIGTKHEVGVDYPAFLLLGIGRLMEANCLASCEPPHLRSLVSAVSKLMLGVDVYVRKDVAAVLQSVFHLEQPPLRVHECAQLIMVELSKVLLVPSSQMSVKDVIETMHSIAEFPVSFNNVQVIHRPDIIYQYTLQNILNKDKMAELQQLASFRKDFGVSTSRSLYLLRVWHGPAWSEICQKLIEKSLQDASHAKDGFEFSAVSALETVSILSRVLSHLPPGYHRDELTKTTVMLVNYLLDRLRQEGCFMFLDPALDVPRMAAVLPSVLRRIESVQMSSKSTNQAAPCYDEIATRLNIPFFIPTLKKAVLKSIEDYPIFSPLHWLPFKSSTSNSTSNSPLSVRTKASSSVSQAASIDDLLRLVNLTRNLAAAPTCISDHAVRQLALTPAMKALMDGLSMKGGFLASCSSYLQWLSVHAEDASIISSANVKETLGSGEAFSAVTNLILNCQFLGVTEDFLCNLSKNSSHCINRILECYLPHASPSDIAALLLAGNIDREQVGRAKVMPDSLLNRAQELSICNKNKNILGVSRSVAEMAFFLQKMHNDVDKGDLDWNWMGETCNHTASLLRSSMEFARDAPFNGAGCSIYFEHLEGIGMKGALFEQLKSRIQLGSFRLLPQESAFALRHSLYDFQKDFNLNDRTFSLKDTETLTPSFTDMSCVERAARRTSDSISSKLDSLILQ